MTFVDTKFLIDYWAGEDRVREYLEETSQRETFVSTTINLKELAVGRAIHGRLDRHEFEGTFGWVTFLPFGEEHAIHAAELEAGLRKRDDVNQARVNALAADLLIAAVARAEGATVVTENVEDFAPFAGVEVTGYG